MATEILSPEAQQQEAPDIYHADYWQTRVDPEHKHAGHDRKREEEKERIAAEVAALSASVNIAIAQLLSEGSKGDHHHNSQKLLSEYEDVQASLSGIISALQDPGARLGELQRRETLINNTFQDEENSTDGSDADDDSDENKPRMRRISVRAAVAKAEKDPQMQSLFARRSALWSLQGDHHALQDNATGSVDDARMDVMAAAALAGLMYANKDKLEGFFENGGYADFMHKTAEKMQEAAQTSGASDAAIEARLQMVLQEADSIFKGMGLGRNEAAGSLATAGEHFIDFHLSKHASQAQAHFADARAHLEGYVSKGHLEDFEKRTQAWMDGMQETAASVKRDFAIAHGAGVQSSSDAPQSLDDLKGLMAETGVTGIFDNLAKMQQDNAKSFKRHAHTFDVAAHSNEKEIKSYMNQRIAEINNDWKSHVYSAHKGQSAGHSA